MCLRPDIWVCSYGWLWNRRLYGIRYYVVMARFFQLVIFIQLIAVLCIQLLLFQLHHEETCISPSYGLPSTCKLFEWDRPYLSWRQKEQINETCPIVSKIVTISDHQSKNCDSVHYFKIYIKDHNAEVIFSNFAFFQSRYIMNFNQ